MITLALLIGGTSLPPTNMQEAMMAVCSAEPAMYRPLDDDTEPAMYRYLDVDRVIDERRQRIASAAGLSDEQTEMLNRLCDANLVKYFEAERAALRNVRVVYERK